MTSVQEDDISTLRQFSELHREIKQLHKKHLQSIKGVKKKRNAASAELLGIMKSANVQCWQLENGMYARLSNARSCKAITPSLIKSAIADTVTPELLRELLTSGKVAPLKNAILTSVRDMRTTTKPVVLFTVKKPRGSEEPTAAPPAFSEKVRESQQHKELLYSAQLNYKQKVHALKATQDQVTDRVDKFLLKSEQTRVTGETGTIIRKQVTSKSPILMPQLQQALQNVLNAVTSDTTVEQLATHIIAEMENLRVSKSNEVIVLHTTKKRKRVQTQPNQ